MTNFTYIHCKNSLAKMLIFNRSVTSEEVTISCQEPVTFRRILYIISYSYWLHLHHILYDFNVAVDGGSVLVRNGLLDLLQSQTGQRLLLPIVSSDLASYKRHSM